MVFGGRRKEEKRERELRTLFLRGHSYFTSLRFFACLRRNKMDFDAVLGGDDVDFGILC